MIGWIPVLAWAVGAYHLQDVTTTRPDPDITRVEYHVMAGESSLNRFSITRRAPPRLSKRQGACHSAQPISLARLLLRNHGD
jgi:hypothetical protein